MFLFCPSPPPSPDFSTDTSRLLGGGEGKGEGGACGEVPKPALPQISLPVNLLALALPFWLFNCPLPAPNARCGKDVQMAFRAGVFGIPHAPPPLFTVYRLAAS